MRRGKAKRPQENLEGLITGGLANAHRAARSSLSVEPSEFAVSGRVATARQVVCTPIRKLLQQGVINAIEADAAALLRNDHDSALASSRCILDQAGQRVDGGRDGMGDADRRFERLDRYRRAMSHLRPDLAAVARAVIVDAGDVPCAGSLKGVGSSILPHGSAPEQIGGGKVALALVCRELAVFYGLTRRPKAA